MGIYAISVPANAPVGLVASAYGAAGWTASASVYSVVAAGAGTQWLVWNASVAALAGEPLNAIRVSGSHAFTTAGGVSSRTVNGYARVGRTLADFNGGAGDANLGVIAATGASVAVNTTFGKAGWTSNDLGSALVGIAGNTSAADAGFGAGSYYISLLDWVFYTGSDQPNPPAGSPSANLVSAPANSNPGRLPEAQFSSVRATWTGVAQSFLSFDFSIAGPAGIKFSNGTQFIRILTPNYPTPGWDFGDTGAINIARGTAPGRYTLQCQVNHNAPPYALYLTTPLTVAGLPPTGHTEV